MKANPYMEEIRKKILCSGVEPFPIIIDDLEIPDCKITSYSYDTLSGIATISFTNIDMARDLSLRKRTIKCPLDNEFHEPKKFLDITMKRVLEQNNLLSVCDEPWKRDGPWQSPGNLGLEESGDIESEGYYEHPLMGIDKDTDPENMDIWVTGMDVCKSIHAKDNLPIAEGGKGCLNQK